MAEDNTLSNDKSPSEGQTRYQRNKEQERERAKLNRQKQREKKALELRTDPAYAEGVRSSNKDVRSVRVRNEDEEMEAIADKYAAPVSMSKQDSEDLNSVEYRMNLAQGGREYLAERMLDFTQYVARDIPQLKNRGFRWVTVTIKTGVSNGNHAKG